MPRPPPPNAALIATGQPFDSPNAITSSADVRNSVVPGTPATPAASAARRGRHLVAHHLDRLGRRTDERHALRADRPGEVGVLREEAVAGMHRLGARALDDLEDLLGVEVALGRGLAAERVGLVGQADVQGVSVELGVHGHGGDAELAAGADHAHGDLGPVGDQDLGEHGRMFTAVLGDAAKRAMALTRFSDVRWVDETGSTNADLLALAREGGSEGIVLIADHQTAGRGRAGRSWVAPAGASLLVSVLVRPPASVAGLSSMAMALAASDAVDDTASFRPRLKWPNDLVWPGDGSAVDRKLAGILAEAHWPSEEEVAVVIGIGLNVNWPAALPEELRDIATAINRVAGRDVDREDVLVHLLQRLDQRYDQLLNGGILDAWRANSATLGRRVRVDLGAETIEGIAHDITAEGHLIVGDRTIAVGDVVHLRVEGPGL